MNRKNRRAAQRKAFAAQRRAMLENWLTPAVLYQLLKPRR
jgi:hypothetical protein